MDQVEVVESVVEDQTKDEILGKTILGAVVSLDGFIADDNDGVGPLFDEHADTAPFTFVDDVEKAIAGAKEFAGDRDVDVAAGQIGSQALKLGLIDEVVVSQVPVVFGCSRPFFTGGLDEPLLLENPTTIVRGDRLIHLVYPVRR